MQRSNQGGQHLDFTSTTVAASLLYSAHSWFYELDFYSTETRINVTSATAAAPYGALRGWLTVVVVCVGCVMSLMTVDDACGTGLEAPPLFCFETTKF